MTNVANAVPAEPVANSRQVRRQVERQVAKAGEQVYAARLRQQHREALRQRGTGLAPDLSMGLFYPQHFDRIANPSAIEQAIMKQGIRL